MSVSQGLTGVPAPASLPSARSTKKLKVMLGALHPGGMGCARTRGATPRMSKLASTATPAAARAARPDARRRSSGDVMVCTVAPPGLAPLETAEC